MLLKAEDASSCRVRMRSEVLDVSRIARALGGGGHKEAAGATIGKGFEKAKSILKEKIGVYL